MSNITRNWVSTRPSDFPPSVNWDNTDVVEGEILRRSIVIFDGDERQVITIKTDEGPVNVWVSSGMHGILDLPSGIYVRITHEGWKKSLKTGRRFRSFKVEYDLVTKIKLAEEPV